VNHAVCLLDGGGFLVRLMVFFRVFWCLNGCEGDCCLNSTKDL